MKRVPLPGGQLSIYRKSELAIKIFERGRVIVIVPLYIDVDRILYYPMYFSLMTM